MHNLSLQPNGMSNGPAPATQRPMAPYQPPTGPSIQQPGLPPPSAPKPASQMRPAANLRPTMNMRPNPAPARPLPPGYAGTPPQNTYAGPDQMAPGSQPQQAKLSSSMMPRPSGSEPPCGTARSYYHRGMSLVSEGSSFPNIPSSNADFISVDDGSARLRFMRLTTNAIASDPSAMARSGLPLAVMMAPFANLAPGEQPVPIVDFSAKQIGGPLRCERCNAYANPGFKFMSGGSQFQCNLCTHVNTTPTEHFSPISPATGLRMDADQRHELRLGSVDYIVGSPDYCIRPPQPPCYLFALDVSSGAISSGLASFAIMSIRSAIASNLLPGSNQGARVAIMTFDRGLHFFDARGTEDGKSVTTQYVPDVMDPFVPLGGDALFLTPKQALHAVDAAIETHELSPSAQQQEKDGPSSAPIECSLASALQAIKLAFTECGGKAFVISGSLPTAGISKLERRGGGAIGGGEDREMGLLKEAVPNYDILGCELADVQATVDLFLAPSSVYIDAATLGKVPRACGGRMHLFTAFDPIRDGASLHRSLCVAASEPRAFEALLRVRTSPGLDVKGEYIGHFGRPQRGDDIAGPVFDASSTIGLEITVSSKLIADDRRGGNRYGGSPSLFDDACVQSATLYTDCLGRRCIRVHTMFAQKTTVLAEVFRHADVDATAAFLAKKASAAVLIGGTSFSKASEALTEKTAQAFYVYRKHCTTASLSGQLILPEALKVLPVMMLGLLKSAAFRKAALSMQSADAVTVDERAAALSFINCAKVSEVAALCYPRMWDITALDERAGIPLPPPEEPMVTNMSGEAAHPRNPTKEPIALPNTLPLAAESLIDNKMLLVENAMQMVLWLGSRVDKKEAEEVIAQVGPGRLCIRAETAGSAALTKDISEKGKRIAKIINRIVSERRGLSRPQVVVRNAPGAGGEAKFLNPLLVEDQGSSQYSYVSYLRQIHKRVMDKMSNDSAQSDLQTWEMLNHGY